MRIAQKFSDSNVTLLQGFFSLWKRGAHLLAPGSAGVEGRFLREIMLLLDGISMGGTKHKR